MSHTAAILVIGNEILSGKVQDANSPFLAKELRELGAQVERIHVVPDELAVISAHVRELAGAYTWLFTSGGIGPTHDDITIASIAHALDRQVVRHPTLVEIITNFFPPNEMPPESLKMAEMPEGAVLHTEGDIRFPVMQVENIFILPGIPEILRRNFLAVREQFRADTSYHLRNFYLQVYESDLAGTLNAWLEEYPRIDCGSYPVLGNADWHVRVTVESRDPEYLESAVANLKGRLDPDIIFAIE